MTGCMCLFFFFFFFKQKTAYEIPKRDWSSDVCSSDLCADLVRPGGRVANIGVHGHPATLHLERLWIRNVTITTGLVDTSSTPTLLRLVSEERLDPRPFATHRFGQDEILDAYGVFA